MSLSICLQCKMMIVAKVCLKMLQDHFGPDAGAMCPRHDVPAEGVVSLPDLFQHVPRLIEFLSPGCAAVLLATCSQLREAVCPLVTKITIIEPNGVDFSVLLNSRWSNIQCFTLYNREASDQNMYQIIGAKWPIMTSLTLDHCSFNSPKAKA